MRTIINFLMCFALAAALVSCGGTGSEKDAGQNDSTTVEKVSISDYMANPEKWAEKEILVSGTVTHTCRHSGKKMFMIGDDPEKTIKILAGENISKFDISLEGLVVEVIGLVKEDGRIDEEALKEMEEEIKQAIEDGDIKVCTADKNAALGNDAGKNDSTAVEDPYADVNALRAKLKASGKAYLSVFAIECKSFKEVKQ